jgi:hypothetical protein
LSTQLVSLIDIQIIAGVNKKRPSRRPDHFVVFRLNDEEVVQSKKYRLSTSQWQVDHKL